MSLLIWQKLFIIVLEIHVDLLIILLCIVFLEQVSEFFSCLNDKKSSLDVPNKLVRLASKTLSKLLAFIFNNSISTGIVPDYLKFQSNSCF